ncbi:hypothetical protein [Leifsonia aquatica]|nr:hypothetical protein [Leifsonia aquatica]
MKTKDRTARPKFDPPIPVSSFLIGIAVGVVALVVLPVVVGGGW